MSASANKLTPRQKLLEEISDRFCAAVQSDLENGVACLNRKAALDFAATYPSIAETIDWINKMCIEEMPDDH